MPSNGTAQQTNNYSQATDKALEAFYYQSGLKTEGDAIQKHVENYAKKFDTKYVPDYLNTPIGVTAFLVKAASEHQIMCKWSF